MSALPGNPLRKAIGALLAAFALLTSLLATVGPAQAAEVDLPGGKANWVVSVGGLNTAAVNNYRNWARLGYYTFKSDGTATSSHWSWNQRDMPVRVDSGVTADCDSASGVPQCAVQTVDGFTSDNPHGGFHGTFNYSSTTKRLTVTWTTDGAGTPLSPVLSEKWNVEPALNDGGVARITSPTYYGAYTPPGTVEVPVLGVFSSYTATFGVGYGSNAPTDRASRASMSELTTDGRRYKGAFVVAKTGIVGREGTGSLPADKPGFWSLKDYSVCKNGACIGWLQPNSTCDGNNNRVRYIAEIGGGRRNTEWYWCQSLAQGQPCYKYNSHPRPMLQIIDDSGKFQGWVGIEAFTHVETGTAGQVPTGKHASGYWGIFDRVPEALNPGVQ
ncbi:hypothetical protein ACIHCQ_09725 [Streptomyces sp. NPDC052236]|uniref:hypothetical protein n=1 Tax=Streptomyces sp. NPDC052236 TaxID=3365686 RepID=UPI0037CE2C84